MHPPHDENITKYMQVSGYCGWQFKNCMISILIIITQHLLVRCSARSVLPEIKVYCVSQCPQIGLNIDKIDNQNNKMYSVKFICLFNLLLFTCFCKTLLQVKQETEQKIINLANEVTRLYSNRCADDILACGIKTQNGCLGSAERKCYEDFAHIPQCQQKGGFLSEEHVMVFPFNKIQDIQNLDGEDIQYVCSTAGISQYLKDFYKFPFKWIYIGNYNGLMINYPGTRFGCQQYDPRFRPWYVAAITGRKNVILMIDISASMQTGSVPKIQVAIAAARTLIELLGPGDTISVIVFNSVANTLHFSKIVSGTDSNKAYIISAIKKINSTNINDSSYMKAFQKAFDLIERASEQNLSPCINQMNVIFLMTDQSSQEEVLTEELTTYIDSQITDYDIHLFTYGFGDVEDSPRRTFLKELSCRYNGIYFSIKSSISTSQLAEIMREYTIFLSHGVTVERPMWTLPYFDKWMREDVISVSYPIYYEEQDSPGIRILLGVAGTDLALSFLQQYGITQENAPLFFINVVECQKNTLTQCQMQNLRQSQSDYAVCQSDQICPETGTIESLCPDRTYPQVSQIFAQPQDTTYDSCCGLAVNQVVIIIALSVVGFLILLSITIFFICRKLRNNDSSQSSQAEGPGESGKNLQTEQNMRDSMPPQNRFQHQTFHNDPSGYPFNMSNMNAQPIPIYGPPVAYGAPYYPNNGMPENIPPQNAPPPSSSNIGE